MCHCVQRRAAAQAPRASSSLNPDTKAAAMTVVHKFINRWRKGDIHGISEILTDDCLILEPLWAAPGSKPVLSGIAEVSLFRQTMKDHSPFCKANEHTTFNVLDVAATSTSDEDRIYLQFRETNSRSALVWEAIKTAIKTRLLFPLYQSDEAGVIMFKLTKDARIKEIVCLRRPPELEDTTGKILQDDYSHAVADNSQQVLSLFDRM
jgi:hypothetical protein